MMIGIAKVVTLESKKGNVRCEPDCWDHGPDRIDARTESLQGVSDAAAPIIHSNDSTWPID